MTEALVESSELQGCIIPPSILSYCLELSERWRGNAQPELALLATEAGMLVCSPAVPHQAQLEMNNVKQMLQERLQKPVVTAYASAANIRSLLDEAERQHGTDGQLHQSAGTMNVTRAQQTLTDLVSEALAMQASDIHLRFTPVRAVVNFRVKGRLVGARYRSREAMVESIAAALNTYSNDYREVFNEDSCDSASIDLELPATATHEAQRVRLRLQKSPINHGFAVTLRLLPEQQRALSLSELNMPGDVQAGIHELIKHQHGLILIVGATGHGKTTTLAAVNQLFGQDRKIISLEDPIEIVQRGVEQRWVDGQSECFSDHIKIALREDPDVISISEIRDAQTAQAALMAALTGHLVTATLHAHDCIGAIQRLTNLGLRMSELIASGVLQGIVAQHLIHAKQQPMLIAEYVLMDHPARRFLRREDYSGWRDHLCLQGWQSMAARWRAQPSVRGSLSEPAQVYQYKAEGPCAR